MPDPFPQRAPVAPLNFSCDKCQRRYSIADEKVRGKTVKVRCKNCQNVISVQGPPAEMEESTRVVSLADVEKLREQERAMAAASSAPAAPAASPWDEEPTRAAPARAASAPWFVMVKSKQEGPLDEAGLMGLVQSGAINARSFFWQQGMADWKRGADLPELAGIFAAPPPPAAPAPQLPAEPHTVPARGQRGAGASARAQPQPEPAPEMDNSWDNVPTTVGRAPVVQREPWDLDPPAAAQQQPQQRQRQQAAAWEEPAQPQQQAAWDDSQQQEQEQQQAWDDSQQQEQQQAAWDEPQQQEQQQAWDDSQQQEQQQQAAWDDPEQAQPLQSPARPSGGKAGVSDDLFSDLDLPDKGNTAEESESPLAVAEPDPLAAVGGKKKKDDKKPVEDTRHFMVKSGVTKRNPVWKVALFVLMPIFLVVGALYALSTLNVVPLKVTTTNEKGETVQTDIFSGKGVSELRDRLMGAKKPPPAPPPAPPEEKKPPAGGAQKSPDAPAPEEGKAATPETGKSAEELKALYGDSSKTDVSPEVRKEAEIAAKDAAGQGGPPAEDIQKVVSQSQGAIQDCVEKELRKNPSFKAGKVLLVATVGTSGTVKSARLDPKSLDASTVGDCIKKSAKRMVFPAFKLEDGGEELDLEIPLVLTSGSM
jgi:predicted Zn finger-like uncharacterized protein